MESETKVKDARLSIRLSSNLHKALKYAKIETGKSTEMLVSDAIKSHMLKLGFLKESGELNKPDAIPIEA